MKHLNFSPDLAFPLDAVTQKLAFLGTSGSGKTYAAGKFVEELLDVEAQVVIIDNVGNWWGLRLEASGKKPSGYDLPILGGIKGDVILKPDHGKLVAETIVHSRSSMIVNIAEFSTSEAQHFVVDFATHLLKLQMGHPAPIMVVWEEIHEIVPQRPSSREEWAIARAVEKLIKRGRNYGVGSLLISQRSAAVNKDVLNQVETVLCFRTSGPQDRDAIQKWVDRKGFTVDWEELPRIQTGSAWCWSPHWLQALEKIRIGVKKTFDASATPKFGKTKKANALSPIDLTKFEASMGEVIEESKANDPLLLRGRIKTLERELEKTRVEAAAPKAVTMKPVPMLTEVDWKRLEKFVGKLESEHNRFGAQVEFLNTQRDRLAQAQQAILSELGNVKTLITKRAASPPPAPVRPPGAYGRNVPTIAPPARIVVSTDGPAGDLNGPELRILAAIAWSEAIGIPEPQLTAVAFLAGYRIGGGAFNNPKSRLHKLGHVNYLSGGRISLTSTGRAVAPRTEQLLSTEALHAAVLDKLDGPEQRLLKPLLEAYPKTLTNEDLAAAAGYESGGGAFNNPKGRLRSLGVIEYPDRGTARAAAFLFL